MYAGVTVMNFNEYLQITLIEMINIQNKMIYISNIDNSSKKIDENLDDLVRNSNDIYNTMLLQMKEKEIHELEEQQKTDVYDNIPKEEDKTYKKRLFHR